MELALSQELWCLYNSPFLKFFMGFVTFGSFPYIIPKLFSELHEKNSVTPRLHLQYNKAVKWFKPLGRIVLYFSGSTIIIYLVIWLSVNGNIKCDEKIIIAPYEIGLLYFSSIIVLMLFGFFFHYWKIIEKGCEKN